MTGRAAPGWYPDYEAPPGHQRFWDGERWTERRSAAPGRGPTRRLLGWLAVGAAAVVLATAAVLVLTHDPSTSPGSGAEPPPASTPPATSSPAEPGTFVVAGVSDDATIRLADGDQVVLVGVSVGECAISTLAQLVDGQQVGLTQPGPDADSQGRLLRYVDRDGLDVGLRLIQRGLATASDDANPRRAIYRRVDDRSPDVC